MPKLKKKEKHGKKIYILFQSSLMKKIGISMYPKYIRQVGNILNVHITMGKKIKEKLNMKTFQRIITIRNYQEIYRNMFRRKTLYA